MGSLAYEMFAHHDWLVPRLYDHAHFNKPPLLYWIMVLFFKLGGVNEWMARLPSGLSALGALVLTFDLARRLLGPEKAAPAALILLTSPLFFAMSQIIDYNMFLTFWVTLGVWAVVAWTQDGKSWQRWFFYFALALAFLTKGPVGPAVVVLALAGFRYRGGPWRPLWHPTAFLVCVALALSWFVAVALRYPELWDYFLRGELFDRFFTGAHHRQKPFFYYLLVIPAGILPWLWWVARFFRASARNVDPSTARLLSAWLILPLIMFTACKSKMPTYVLPLLPALALMAAAQLSVRPRVFVTYAASLLLLYQIALGVVFHCEQQLHSKTSTRSLAHAILREARAGDRIALAGRHPSGLSFYLHRPVSVPLYKFEIQIASDRERVKDKDFDNVRMPFDWFDSTQRTFLVCSEKTAAERQRDAKQKVRTVCYDGERVLICNQ